MGLGCGKLSLVLVQCPLRLIRLDPSVQVNVTHPSTSQASKAYPYGWFSTVPAELTAGVVVALALIPEAIAFSLIAGLDPQVGLHTSFAMAVTMAFLGARIGMISSATGAMALLLKDLVGVTGDNALEYVLAVTLLTGFLQIVWGSLQIGRIMAYVPRSVLVGFVNALAMMIFWAQLEQFTKAAEVGASVPMYLAVLAGLAIIYLLPSVTKNIPMLRAIPSPLVAIVALTATTVSFGIPLPTVGDMGTLPSSLPLFRLPNLPFNLQTLQLILPVALSLSAVGLLESFLTMSALDDMTNTSNNYGGQKNGDQKNDPKSDPNNDPENNQKNDPNKDARAQGAANLVTGLLGGMAGGATMGPSMINFQTGGRQRLSMLSAGIFLLFFVLVMRQWISLIPTAALVSVMFMVSFRTFDRDFLASLRQRPARETVVVVATVISAVATGNLAVGMIVGIALSA